ncbi:transglutaminase family protein, partial [Angustibacter speluncae]
GDGRRVAVVGSGVAGLVAAWAAVTAVAAALAADRAVVGARQVWVLAPAALVVVAALAVTSPVPQPVPLLVPVVVLGLLLLVLDPLLLRTGEGWRSLLAGVPLAVVAVVAGAVASSALADGGRPPVDLRADLAVPVTPRQPVNPLSLYAASQTNPPRTVAVVTGGQVPDRFPMVSLDEFDGSGWTADATYQRAGRDLPPGPVAGRTASTTTTFEVLAPDLLDWLPSPGRPTRVSVSGLGVDPADGDVAVPLGAQLPPVVTVTGVRPDPDDDVLLDAGPGTDLPDLAHVVGADAPLLAELVEQARSRPDGFARAAQVQAALRDPNRFARTEPDDEAGLPTGNGLVQVERLLETGAGSPEQYASALALASRLLGVDSRVVVGYLVPDRPGAQDDVELSSRDLHVWTEVRLEDVGWVPLEATPGAGRAAVPVPEPVPAPGGGDDTGAAPGTDDEAPGRDEDDPAAQAAGSSSGALVGTLVAGGAFVLLVLLSPPVLKGWRRRRRRAAPPDRAVAGVWDEALDRLTEQRALPRRPSAGARVPEDVVVLVGAPALGDLATRAQRARFSGRATDPEEVDRAWAELVAFERGLASGRPWWRRLRDRFDPGPLLRR